MKNWYFLLLALLSIASCTRDADIDLPEVDPTLSVSCFISPEKEMTSATIFWTQPVFNNQTLPLFPSDLTVVIFGNGTIDTMVYNDISSNYELPATEFPIVAGQEYRIEVTAPNGVKVSGSTRVPVELPSVASFEIEKNERTDPDGLQYNEYVFKLLLNDPSPSFNYYQTLYYRVVNGFSGVIAENYKDDSSLQNGKVYSEAEYSEYIQYFGEIPEIISDSLQYIVVNGAEEYYRFHKTLQNQNPGDPFSEPVIVYSNIENGVGVFAGYRSLVTKVELP